MIIQHYKTPSPGEEVANLPMGDINNHYPQIVYQLKLVNLKAGDIIFALSESEFTSENDFIVWTVTGIILTENPNDLNGIEIAKWNGHNVNQKLIHHITHIKHGTLVVDKDYPEAYVSLVARADGCIPKPTLPTWKDWLNNIGFSFEPDLAEILPVVVEQNYGNLSVFVYKQQ